MKRHVFLVSVLLGVILVLLVVAAFMAAQLEWQSDSADTAFHDETTPHGAEYMNDEEAVIIPASETQAEAVVLPIKKVLFEYVEVTEGCGPYYKEECVNVRSGPGEDYPVVSRLRNGVVLKVGGKVEREGGRTWYKIVFDEWKRYPERIVGDWYVAGDYVQVLYNEGDRDYSNGSYGSSTKRIVVERSKQMLYAYDGDELFMEERISTGRELTPTPRGTFKVYKKTPSRYMQGPIPGITDKYYDLPGVPWNLYFTYEGAVIHGAYWHDNFGFPSSNGCVNLPTKKAKKLYLWAEVGMLVVVRD